MKRLRMILFGGKDAGPEERELHERYILAGLLVLGVLNGLIALDLTAHCYAPIEPARYWASFAARPVTVLLNLLPPVLLVLLGWFLTRRAWAAQLLSSVPTLALALANFFKVQLRGDPLVATDVQLIRTAGGAAVMYSPDFPPAVLRALVLPALLFLFSVLLLPDSRPRHRLAGALVCLLLIPLLYSQVYMSMYLYGLTDNPDAIDNKWSETEVFLSRGFWYPFIRSVSHVLNNMPQGYNARAAQDLLDSFESGDIPANQKVQVVGVMLEAFADLSEYPELSRYPELRSIYTPLHRLEAESVSGSLLTNIFAGGTVDTEWAFLTGFSHHGQLRAPLHSYVYYFNGQGYETVYRHPGHDYFYNRRHINEYLGFSGSMFSENGFQELVDVESAPRHSDKELFTYLLSELKGRKPEEPPLFSFSVSYQNHGPYGEKESPAYFVTEEETGWPASSVNILNRYLYGVSDTIGELVRFTEGLRSLDQPVVLVVFGDHKPWLGNDMDVYTQIGVHMELDTLDGFYNYYATPYLIWANDAAKEALGNDFQGAGGDFSPCFLMQELFDLCSWEGPSFMNLSREMRAATPLVHEQELFLVDGELTDTLPPETRELYLQYRRAEYWLEKNKP